ncbi:MAG: sugar transferase [Propioniciclava sp.]|uniref:sugar transferase n=1 Tax=Propioniciclava sp. TaxID=2038686 RepID=UPI0039E36827
MPLVPHERLPPCPEEDIIYRISTHDVGTASSGSTPGVLVADRAVTIERPTGAPKSPRWQSSYTRWLVLTDLLVILASVYGAQFLRFGIIGSTENVGMDWRWDITLSYTGLSALLTVVWMMALQVADTRECRVIGAGFTEYKRVIDSTVWTFGVFAILDVMFKVSAARGYLFIAFPLGLALLLTSRFLWRKWMHAQRRLGRFQYRAIVVGDYAKSAHVGRQIVRQPNAEYRIVGAVTDPGPAEKSSLLGVVRPTRTYSISTIMTLIDDVKADTLILTSSDTLEPASMRRLGWALEEQGVELVVAPALTDIAGPRIHTRPVAGLPLLHIEFPEFDGRKYWVKRAFDIVVSAALIVLLSPVLAAVALAVKLTSPGPLLFKHTRIGQNGQPFQMLKFRSMVVNADAQLKELLAQQGTDGKPLFKVRNDPRITPVGKFIRKYSLDELPQLFNALLGTMSLVGPRPQVEGEVALYDNAAARRLLVKPGLTGLWQVSGRSNLAWEDALRLDLYYVENWSLSGDIVILFRTVKAVVTPDGAV